MRDVRRFRVRGAKGICARLNLKGTPWGVWAPKR